MLGGTYAWTRLQYTYFPNGFFAMFAYLLRCPFTVLSSNEETGF
jgi:hypothetical protein